MSASRSAGCRAGIAVAVLAETNRSGWPWAAFLLNMNCHSKLRKRKGASRRSVSSGARCRSCLPPLDFDDEVRIEARIILVTGPVAFRIRHHPRVTDHRVFEFVRVALGSSDSLSPTQ